jgi:hypothetical protein
MEWEIYTLMIAGTAAYGGYHVGARGDDKNTGVMGSMLAALLFAVPMGFWLAFNVLAYALKGGRPGFAPEDVREAVWLLLFGIAIWLCAAAVGFVRRVWVS